MGLLNPLEAPHPSTLAAAPKTSHSQATECAPSVALPSLPHQHSVSPFAFGKDSWETLLPSHIFPTVSMVSTALVGGQLD